MLNTDEMRLLRDAAQQHDDAPVEMSAGILRRLLQAAADPRAPDLEDQGPAFKAERDLVAIQARHLDEARMRIGTLEDQVRGLQLRVGEQSRRASTVERDVDAARQVLLTP